MTLEDRAPQSEANESFRALVDRAVSGDEGALAEIFQRVQKADGSGPLQAMARRLLPQDDRAREFIESSDLVQTALRSGWVDLAQFRGESFEEFLGWLRTILRHKLHRALRRRRPHLAGDGIEGLGQGLEAASADRPEGEVLREEARERLKDAIHILSEDQQLVLELRLRGMRSVDIAEKLGVDAGVIRQREFRALRKLREHLGGEG